MTHWHLHPQIVGTYGLRVGLEIRSSIAVTATETGGCIPEPLPITIDRGVNVAVIDTATGNPVNEDQVLDSFLVAYPE